jgi:DNA-binding transcriptional LysR family regulator
MNNKFDNIYLMRLFTAIVQFGSFSAAAKHIGITASKASKDIKYLEKSLDSPLLSRTTRNVNLTDAGELFFYTSQEILEIHSQLIDSIKNKKESLSGELRITAPELWGVNVLTPIILAFKHLHRDVTFTVDFSNDLRELHRENIHIAFRSTELTNEPYLSRMITDNEYILCASKQYLEQTTPIVQFKELSNLQIIGLTTGNDKISFLHKKQTIIHTYKSELSFSSSFAIYLAVKSGIGIAVLPKHMINKELESSELVEILPEYRINKTTIYALYTQRRQQSKLVNNFINFAYQKLS